MDELEQTLLRLRRSVEHRVHLKLTRALPAQPLRVKSYQADEAGVSEASQPQLVPRPPPPSNRSFWGRLTEFAARRFHR